MHYNLSDFVTNDLFDFLMTIIPKLASQLTPNPQIFSVPPFLNLLYTLCFLLNLGSQYLKLS